MKFVFGTHHMNAFPYFPFGLTRSTVWVTGWMMSRLKNDVKGVGEETGNGNDRRMLVPVLWTIMAGAVISLTIESWQYLAGTGLAQGTDVIMNTLGAAIGTVPWVIVQTGVAEKIKEMCYRFR